MLKRTRGYVLLTLLVLTGFAGQVSNKTITNKERQTLVANLKASKQALLLSLEEVTASQLTFKPSIASESILQKIQILNAAQLSLLETVQTTIRQPDDQKCFAWVQDIQIGKTSKPDTETLLDEVKAVQSKLIKYAKTTTEDIHGHPIEIEGRTVDSYQALLLLPQLAQKCVKEIEELKKNPRFP
ncbi:MAG: hypothetical protein JWP69_643 [Flaviaesturariibacter sp.]|nr:hypothetical protein [Flaviaesturariibacter sp.]